MRTARAISVSLDLQMMKLKRELCRMDFPIYTFSLFQSHTTLTKGGLTSTVMVNDTHQCALQFSGIFDRHVLLVSLRPFNYNGEEQRENKGGLISGNMLHIF